MSGNSDKVDRHVGRRLRDKRLAEEVTQAELAEELGVPTGDVRLYEEGRKRIPPRLLVQASELLNIDINWFFEGAPEAEPKPEVARASKELARFLAMPESVALIRAFVAIPTHNERQAVVDFAQRAGGTGAAARRH